VVAVAEEPEQGLAFESALRFRFDLADVDFLLRFLHRSLPPSVSRKPGAFPAPAISSQAMRVLWVFLAGGLGSAARYGVAVACASAFGIGFPWGTLAVNLLGSFAIALIAELALARDAFSPELRLALTTGFLGGFTTYSAFGFESFALLRDGAMGLGLGYVALTVVGGLAMCVLGLVTARVLFPS
jgi:CrcB protein